MASTAGAISFPIKIVDGVEYRSDPLTGLASRLNPARASR